MAKSIVISIINAQDVVAYLIKLAAKKKDSSPTAEAVRIIREEMKK